LSRSHGRFENRADGTARQTATALEIAVHEGRLLIQLAAWLVSRIGTGARVKRGRRARRGEVEYGGEGR